MNNEKLPVPNIPSDNNVINNSTPINQDVTPVISQTSASKQNLTVKEPLFNDKHSYREFFKDIIKYISSKNSNELLSLLWRLLLIAGFIIILGTPFLLLKDLIPEFMISFGMSFDKTGQDMLNLAFLLLYTILGIYLLFKLCKERFYKLVKNTEEMKKLEEQVKNE